MFDYDYGEDFNQPDYVKIDREEYQKEQENLEYYKTTIDMIKDELYGIEGLTKEYEETFNEIKRYIKELEQELN